MHDCNNTETKSATSTSTQGGESGDLKDSNSNFNSHTVYVPGYSLLIDCVVTDQRDKGRFYTSY